MSCDGCLSVEGTAAPRSRQRTSRPVDRARLLHSTPNSTPTPRTLHESPEPPRPTPRSPWSGFETANWIHSESPPSAMSILSVASEAKCQDSSSTCTCLPNWLSVPKLKEAASFARQLADALDDAVLQSSSQELLTQTPVIHSQQIDMETSSQELEEFIQLEQKFSRCSSVSLQNDNMFIPVKIPGTDSELSKEDQIRIQQIEEKYSRCSSVNSSVENQPTSYVNEFLKRIEEKKIVTPHHNYAPKLPEWDIDQKSDSVSTLKENILIKNNPFNDLMKMENKYFYLNLEPKDFNEKELNVQIINRLDKSYDEIELKNSINELKVLECTRNLKLQLNDELKNVLSERRLRLKPVHNSSLSDLSVIEDCDSNFNQFKDTTLLEL